MSQYNIERSTTVEDKIIELLGRGYSQTVVASAVGCDDSYISQLMAKEEVRNQVATLRLQHVAVHVEMEIGRAHV